MIQQAPRENTYSTYNRLCGRQIEIDNPLTHRGPTYICSSARVYSMLSVSSLLLQYFEAEGCNIHVAAALNSNYLSITTTMWYSTTSISGSIAEETLSPPHRVGVADSHKIIKGEKDHVIQRSDMSRRRARRMRIRRLPPCLHGQKKSSYAGKNDSSSFGDNNAEEQQTTAE